MNDSTQWDRVRQLFHDALDAAPGERLAFVRARTRDPEVLAEVESLLAAYPAAEGFLDQQADQRQVSEACADLRPGETLGSFEIVELIGAGGMGEVYRARDTRLDRDVAIKVLSGELGDAGWRREALEREARAIAKLTHPRISTLHDVGYARVRGAEVAYLVMELVEGETLAARLSRGPLPLEQCLGVACDLAEALAAAHASGIVHRDLKPGNVMLTKSGAKLLDFGIAVGRAPGPPSADTPGVLGTPPFMSPEQLRGDAVDARSDLFAFGAMLYEMLSGHRAFSGETPGAIASAVLESEPPPLVNRAPQVPVALQRLVSTCLAKDPDERWQTARDLLRELRWIREDRADHEAAPAKALSPGMGLIGVAVSAALLVVGVAGFPNRPAVDRERVSFSVYPAPGTSFPRGTSDMALSPDGTRLVFVAKNADGVPQLWVRAFDAIEPRVVLGSHGASGPFWSPDGRSIGFFANGKLKRIAAGGGSAQDICDVRFGGKRGAWNSEGTILFGGFGQALLRVPATGGAAAPATVLAASELWHGWPVFLPDGRRFVYLAARTEPGQTAIHQGSLDSTEVRRVHFAESRIGVSSGYLVSLSKGLLLARPYDAERAQTGDASIEIARGIQYDTPLRSGGAFSIAGNAVAFRNASPDSRLIWFNRQGRQLAEFPERADFHHPWLSPDETQLLAEKTDAASGRHSVWVLDLRRGTTSRLLADPSGAHSPMWSPDGTRVSFSSNRFGGVDLFEIAADGSSGERLVLKSDDGAQVTDWSRDGRLLIYENGSSDLFILPLSPGARPEAFLETPAQEGQAQFAPDQRWVAYVSDESGVPEVYVRRLQGGGSRRVSNRGGAQPRWRADGRELFYLAPDGTLMGAAVRRSGDAIEFATPLALFKTGVTTGHLDRRNQYLVTRDGQRVLVNLSEEDVNAAPITVIVNWDANRAQP